MHLWEYFGLVDSGHSSTTVSIKTLLHCEEKADVNDRMMGKLSHWRSWFESCAKQCKLKLLLLPCTILCLVKWSWSRHQWHYTKEHHNYIPS